MGIRSGSDAKVTQNEVRSNTGENIIVAFAATADIRDNIVDQ